MPLIGLAVGLSLAPLAVEAQPAGKVYRPGVLWRSAASPVGPVGPEGSPRARL